MNLIDSLLLTVISTVSCIALPRLISLIFNLGKTTKPHPVISLKKATNHVTSFPFCTTHTLKNTQSCKFSPHFCHKCSQH